MCLWDYAISMKRVMFIEIYVHSIQFTLADKPGLEEYGKYKHQSLTIASSLLKLLSVGINQQRLQNKEIKRMILMKRCQMRRQFGTLDFQPCTCYMETILLIKEWQMIVRLSGLKSNSFAQKLLFFINSSKNASDFNSVNVFLYTSYLAFKSLENAVDNLAVNIS